jgi:hypothetical protein
MHCRFLPVERKRQILEAASGSDDWDGKGARFTDA